MNFSHKVKYNIYFLLFFLYLFCKFFLLCFILCGQLQKPLMADCTVDVVLINPLENPVKFCNSLFGLGDFPLALFRRPFRFLKPLLIYRLLETHNILKKHGGYIEYPAQHKPFQRFLADKVHGAISRIAFVPRTAVTILLRGHVLARSKMQFAAAVGAVQ